MDADWSLDRFIAEEKARLHQFERHWRQMQAAEGARKWPSTMSDAEWAEQLQVYGWPEDSQ